MVETSDYAHGGDQTKLSEIATAIYGGYSEMLLAHGWERTDGPIMNDVSRGVKSRYGGIRELEKLYIEGLLEASPLLTNSSVWITSFWGWSPENWGGVGFSKEGRLNTISEKTTSPFLMVIYVTENTPEKHFKHLAGKVVGYYELSHQRVMKENIVTPHFYNRADPEKWRYSFKALRAWTIPEEFMPSIRDFYPDIHEKGLAQSVSTWAAELPEKQSKLLSTIPCRLIDVYPQNGDSVVHPIELPTSHKKYVGGGAGRRRGYTVGEPQETEKELYLLKLSGDASKFLHKDIGKKSIYKIGLSMSPTSRQSALNKSFPKITEGLNTAFHWELYKTSTGSGYNKFPDFKSAENAERAVKKYLALESKNSEYLGGEIYATDEAEIKKIWNSVHDEKQTLN